MTSIFSAACDAKLNFQNRLDELLLKRRSEQKKLKVKIKTFSDYIHSAGKDFLLEKKRHQKC